MKKIIIITIAITLLHVASHAQSAERYTSLDKVNALLERVSNGKYGKIFIKDGYLIDSLKKKGEYFKVKIKDLKDTVSVDGTFYKIACKDGSKCFKGFLFGNEWERDSYNYVIKDDLDDSEWDTPEDIFNQLISDLKKGVIK